MFMYCIININKNIWIIGAIFAKKIIIMSELILEKQKRKNLRFSNSLPSLNRILLLMVLKIALFIAMYAVLITMSIYHDNLCLTELLVSAVIFGLLGYMHFRSKSEN